MQATGAIHELLSEIDAQRGARGYGVAVAAATGGPGWVGLDELLDDDRRFDATVDLVARGWGTDRSDIAGGALLADLAFSLLLRSATAFLAGRRTPLLAETGLAVRLDGGSVAGVALGSTFACLAGDERAGDPGARVVDGDDHALLRLLLADFEARHAPLVTRVHVRCRRPRSALWRQLGDAVAQAFLWAGEILSRREDAWAWGREAVAVGAAGLRSHAGYRHFSHAGVAQVGRVRAQCCLHHRTAAATYCFSCPLKGDDHRLAILERRAAEQLAG